MCEPVTKFGSLEVWKRRKTQEACRARRSEVGRAAGGPRLWRSTWKAGRFERRQEVLADSINLLFSHYTGERQGEGDVAQAFGHRKGAALVAEAPGIERLEVDGCEVRPAGDALGSQGPHHDVSI